MDFINKHLALEGRPASLSLSLFLCRSRGLALWTSLLLIAAPLSAGAGLPAPQVKTAETPALSQSPSAEVARLCHSTAEYQAALKYLRGKTELGINETTMRSAADGVSKACDGAAKNFQLVLDHLYGMGVQVGRAIEMAVAVTQASPLAAENFVSILKHAYLREYFDYDFTRALQLAYEFALDAGQPPPQLKADFEQMVEFCLSQKALDLPIQVCAELGIEVAKQSAYFAEGVFPSYRRLYEELRTSPYNLPLNQALSVALQIIRFGPRAPENFTQAYQLARNEEEGLRAQPPEALRFALAMAERSVTSLPPPRAEASAGSAGDSTSGSSSSSSQHPRGRRR